MNGFRYYAWNNWFFRIRGFGLSVEPLKDHKPLFSERYGYRRTWHVFGMCIQPLGPKR